MSQITRALLSVDDLLQQDYFMIRRERAGFTNSNVISETQMLLMGVSMSIS
jgi:hypothetical protein